MAASAGRKATLSWNGAAVAGVKEKSVAINGEGVDITDDGDNGWRTLLADDGIRSVNITVSGVTKDAVLRAARVTGGAGATAAAVFTYADTATLSGDFRIVSYNETGPLEGAMTFEAEFQSTGAVTYTAAV